MRSLVLLALALATGPLLAQTPDPAAPATAPTPAAAQASSDAQKQPTPPAGATQGIANPAVASATPGTAPAAGSTPATGASSDKKDESKPFEVPRGYRKEMRPYGEVYCRIEGESGTRFAKKRCYTQADLEYLAHARKDANEEMMKAIRTCTTAAVCSNN